MSILITQLLARWGRHIAIVAALGVTFAAWNTKMVNKGVTQERARISDIGEKTDARAQVARKKAEAKPDAALKPYYRD